MKSYTHVGCKPHVGYAHIGKDWDHYGQTEGVRHAINVNGETYLSLCGERIPSRNLDCRYDRGDSEHIETAADCNGTGVNCARCRKMLGLTKWTVQYYYLGRWFTKKGHDQHANKADATAACEQLRREKPTYSFRVKMK